MEGIMGLMQSPVYSRHTQLRVATDGSSSSNAEDSISFDKSIYRILSMQDDMKTLQAPIRVRSEFDRFLDDAIKKTNGIAYNVAFDSMDSYLGTIGVTNGIC
jgi:hypothetical protein